MQPCPHAVWCSPASMRAGASFAHFCAPGRCGGCVARPGGRTCTMCGTDAVREMGVRLAIMAGDLPAAFTAGGVLGSCIA